MDVSIKNHYAVMQYNTAQYVRFQFHFYGLFSIILLNMLVFYAVRFCGSKNAFSCQNCVLSALKEVIKNLDIRNDRMKYSYFPGCTLRNKAKDLDFYARTCAEKLGFSLEELPDWQCCGGVYPLGTDEIASKLPSVRALNAAKEKNQDLVAVCSACYHVLKRVNDDMANVTDIQTRANNYMELSEPYTGQTKVLHYLEVLRDVVGFEELKKKVVNPLTGRKIAAYYGCLLLRPSNVMAFDDPENPSIMEDFIRALGAEPVLYPYRNECCGGYISLKEPEMAEKMCNKIVSSADSFEAQCLVTACPLCKYNLSKNGGLPVVYFTELLAEALGIKEADV